MEDAAATEFNPALLPVRPVCALAQVQEQLIFYRSRRATITSDRMCPVCNKRIGTRYAFHGLRAQRVAWRGMADTGLAALCSRTRSAFAFYPNGVIVHYMCSKDPKVSPV